MNTQEAIKQQVTTHPVVLYMKGTPNAPQCGFSAHAVKILNACGVNDIFAVDVLAEPEIRQGIKEYSNWPTIPQLYSTVNLSAVLISLQKCTRTVSYRSCFRDKKDWKSEI